MNKNNWKTRVLLSAIIASSSGFVILVSLFDFSKENAGIVAVTLGIILALTQWIANKRLDKDNER